MCCLLPADDAPQPTRSAIVVPVAAADPVVGEHRDALDRSAWGGVPAHVTVLYPFVEPARIDARVTATVAAAVRPVRAFDCTFAETAWFGEELLWLQPDPAAPFHDLTTRVWRAFPDQRPYAGAHGDDIVAHLTIAERRRGSLAAMRAAERIVQPRLPVTTRIDTVLLIAGAETHRSWRVLAKFRLGQDRDSAAVRGDDRIEGGGFAPQSP